ncbi:oxysterol-binding protein (macronuclear) [Tetrahymena thermophila SB210]|uniref:Oxysterol-binding protein n=1 Tax=Tetrahymena thermophila (strain SB210) TaxID=312017 RepID=Q245K3_TETTS|nr:oxysterol-binding protein [Tetrahymena thermophila SB210]EAS03629.2 oxysterol-binding protein [Tetrahymena thermophila SB210]|eukprot:XP_001023875.2 oxysterol-binding protein [Tetrahymena thermophila SB210]
MEGYLKKQINPFYWKDRYFILHEDCLIYSETQGSEKKGTIHLKIADIIQVPEDPTKIIINSGTKQIEVRAPSVELKVKWYNALKDAQIKAQREFDEMSVEQLKEVTKSSKNLDPKFKRMLMETNQEKIEKLLVEAYEAGARFDETLSYLLPKLTNNPQISQQVDSLQTEAHIIKSTLKECLLSIENERKRLFRASQVIANELDGNFVEDRITRNGGYNRDNTEEHKFYDIEDENNTEFQSIMEDDYFYKEQQSVMILENFANDNVVAKSGQPNNKISQSSLVSYFSKHCPVRYRLLTQNPSYKATEIPDEPVRYTLPIEKDPNEKINVWSILKDSIGKDLTKFAVPVYLNEPISMLQRLAEQMEYSETLDHANETDDQGLALCYCMGFGVSVYAGTINRTKKPFNPLLGETFEFVDEKKGYRFISEQVSHHPPISAGYAESKNYIFQGDSNIKSQFWGKSFEVKPLGNMHIKLRRLNHDIVFKKCTTAAKNIIIGQIYLDHFGEMEYKNYTTGVNGILTLKEKGMFSDKGQYEIDGWVKNKDGKVLYTLKGKWNEDLKCTNAETNQTTVVWKRYPLPEKSDRYYHYTTYAFQLNHLYKDLMKKVPPTDSRLRPDQRALEYGLLSIASEEKLRLEQKQRARRKENEQSGQHHKIVFFEEKMDPLTGEKEYKYKGGYWEARDKGDWSGLGLLDIY